jgi:hypothetical protein
MMEERPPPTEDQLEMDRQMRDGWLPTFPINIERLLAKFTKASYLLSRKITVLGQNFCRLPPDIDEIPLEDLRPMVPTELAEPQDVNIPFNEWDFDVLDPLPSFLE